MNSKDKEQDPITILENVARRLFDEIVKAFTAKDEKLEAALAEAFYIVRKRKEAISGEYSNKCS